MGPETTPKTIFEEWEAVIIKYHDGTEKTTTPEHALELLHSPDAAKKIKSFGKPK